MLNEAEALPVVSVAVMSQVPGGRTGEVDRHRNEIQAGSAMTPRHPDLRQNWEYRSLYTQPGPLCLC